MLDFLKQFRIFQGTVNKQSYQCTQNMAFKNFACIDQQTHKLYLNLESLSDFLADKINFIAIMEQQNKRQQQAVLSISQTPLIILDGISYFLLKTNSLHPDILRIIYLLAHSLYVQSKFVSEIELKISKTINVEGAWDTINYLYVISEQSNTHSGLRTAAETKQLIYRQSKDLVFQKQVAISEKLQIYFTKIFILNFRHKIGFQLQSVRQNLRSQLKQQCLPKNYHNYYFTYTGIMSGFTRLLANKKPLPCKQFHEINIAQICGELQEQAFDNYNLFSQTILNSIQLSQRSKQYQLIQHKLKSVNKEVLRPFDQAKKNSWLCNNEIFAVKQQQIKKYLKEEGLKIIATQSLKKQKNALKVINQQIATDKSKLVGNTKFNGLSIDFSQYKQRICGELYDLFAMICRKQWKQQGKTIKTNRQLLDNLQTRFQINNSKKIGLLSAICLAEKQQQTLNQLSVVNTKNSPKRLKAAINNQKILV